MSTVHSNSPHLECAAIEVRPRPVRSKARPVLCATCGSQVHGTGGDRIKLTCQHCEQHEPSIDVATLGGASRRFLGFRLPLGAVQFALISVTFSVYVTLVSLALHRAPHIQLRQFSAADAVPPTTLISHEHEQPVAVPTVAQATDASLAPSAAAEQRSATGNAVARGRADELAVKVPAGTFTIQQFMQSASLLIGKQIRIQCQLLEASHVDGPLPSKFKIQGETIRINERDAASYRKLRIVDLTGRQFNHAFLDAKGSLSQRFSWVRPGDWLMVSATPGTHYDRKSDRMSWGMIVTDIAPMARK